MNSIALIKTIDDFQKLADFDGLPLLQNEFQRHTPDLHLVLIQDNKTIAAYCSLWWSNIPLYQNETLGLMGHYTAQQMESALALIDAACYQLITQHCTMAIAPIDGNTWNRYRFMSERGTEPIFFLEPDNPDEYCDHFLESGFSVLTTYSSALTADLTQVDPRMAEVSKRLTSSGVSIRSINLDNFERELEKIYQLCLVSFRNNFLYTPIALPDFVAQYSLIKPYVQSELVLIAEQQNEVIGFLFAIPDLLQAKRGEKVSTIVLKTVAVLPQRQFAGLGSLLVSKCHEVAHQIGFDRVIHALMHDDNRSRNISDRYAQTIRRYTLFSKSLSS